MAAAIIDGAAIAQEVRAEAARRTAQLAAQGITPCLAVVLVGTDPASISYVTGKEKALAEAGMIGRDIRLPAHTTQQELLELIASLNDDASVHGILVQLPLPQHISADAVISAIRPDKDADGFHPINAGNLLLGRPAYLPCTPHGVLHLLKRMQIETNGRHAVIVGRSNIVGKPLAVLLARREYNATVTLCHTGTRNLASYTREADILIAAAGKPRMITADMIRPGAAVIDVGVNRIPDPSKKSGFRLCGDVDFEAACEVASYITPVPRGVGPMTIAMLLQNTVQAAEQAQNR